MARSRRLLLGSGGLSLDGGRELSAFQPNNDVGGGVKRGRYVLALAVTGWLPLVAMALIVTATGSGKSRVELPKPLTLIITHET